MHTSCWRLLRDRQLQQCEALIGMDITINTRAATHVTFLMLWLNCGYLTVPEMKMGCFPSTVRPLATPFFRTRGMPFIVGTRPSRPRALCLYKTSPGLGKEPVLRFGENKNTCLSHDRVELSRGLFSNE